MKIKNYLFKLLTVFSVLVIAISTTTTPAAAATPTQISDSIDDGLEWLAAEQEANGSWLFSGPGTSLIYDIATTAIAVLKFEDRAKDLGLDPFDTVNYQYANNVINGLDYIFSYVKNDTLGIHFTDLGWTCAYTVGIAMAAISASAHPTESVPVGKPLAGQTYTQVVEGMIDYLANVQQLDAPWVGGWGYYEDGPGHGDWADNSVSGWVTIGLGYASSAPPDGFGLAIPAPILTGLNTWVTTVQAVGGAYDGGSLYNPGWPIGSAWYNTLKTGNLLYELSQLGVPVGDSTVTSAVGFIDKFWAANGGEYDGAGWLGDYQAMFTMMKGLQAYGINTVGAHDWFDEVSTYIVANQAANGSWVSTSGELQSSTTFSTACALLTLEKAVPSALGLNPATAVNPVNTQHTVTATYLLGGLPQNGVDIMFEIISGPNSPMTVTVATSGAGQASFTYTGANGVGTDVIRATALDAAGAPIVSSEVTKEWQENGPGPGPSSSVPSIAGWGMIAAVIIFVTLIPLAVRRRILGMKV
ncbi:hypothetical protein ACFLV6_00785 [Chloroflexota bacterium]